MLIKNKFFRSNNINKIFFNVKIFKISNIHFSFIKYPSIIDIFVKNTRHYTMEQFIFLTIGLILGILIGKFWIEGKLKNTFANNSKKLEQLLHEEKIEPK
jgi:uncharacterized protein YacL